MKNWIYYKDEQPINPDNYAAYLLIDTDNADMYSKLYIIRFYGNDDSYIDWQFETKEARDLMDKKLKSQMTNMGKCIHEWVLKSVDPKNPHRFLHKCNICGEEKSVC
jgi:hypothetical protein